MRAHQIGDMSGDGAQTGAKNHLGGPFSFLGSSIRQRDKILENARNVIHNQAYVRLGRDGRIYGTMNIRRSKVAFRYMWTAWLSIIRWISLGTMTVFLVIALVNKEPTWFIHAGIAGGAFVVALMLFLLEAPSVRCLGCGGTLLLTMRCAKHKTARRIMGSYTLHCTYILATYAHSVHCPYCGMRYKIYRSTRKEQHEADVVNHGARVAESQAKEDKARKKAESKNMPYY
jgi:hypothetical protein